MLFIVAMASFITLSASVWPYVTARSPPPAATGEAAPMLVLEAIYARLAERVMNVPALAALAPDGPTQTIVGIFECRAASMRSIDDSEPPRVSSWITTALS